MPETSNRLSNDEDVDVESVASELSNALLEADPDLLTAVEKLTPLWDAELESAREDARQQQAAVLARRIDVRDAFLHGAELTKALCSASESLEEAGPETADDDATLIYNLAASDAATRAIALRNLSHTLHLARFLSAAPDLIASATTMLDRVAEAAPASSDLFQAHENICVCERIRDYTLLDALPIGTYVDQVSEIFTGIELAREQLEHYLMANIFLAVPRYAQTDPRVLVAAVRIVQRDGEEDCWWQEHLERSASREAGAFVRPGGPRNYERRMFRAIISSIENTFSKPPAAVQSAEDTLKWIKTLVVEEQESRRFVVPCFPGSYKMGDLFTLEYHRCIMSIITDLFRSTGESRGEQTDSELVKIVDWFKEYRWSLSNGCMSGSLELPRGQRDRLVAAVARHGRAKLLAKVDNVVKVDTSSLIWHKVVTVSVDASTSATSSVPLEVTTQEQQDSGVCTTPGPETVFGAIGQQMKDGRVLGVPDVNTAIGQVAALVLTSYQKGVGGLIAEPPFSTASENYICATANNMARCVDYTDDLRNAMMPHVADAARTALETELDDVVNGFRDLAATAVDQLIDYVATDLKSLTEKFFAPRTGTEVMLDVIDIMKEYFTKYERSLLPIHFEHFAGGCLVRIAAEYLAPFACLEREPGSSRDVDGKSRQSLNDDIRLGSCASSSKSGSREESGLRSMTADAVVAQMAKDVGNLFAFFTSHVKLEKKHVDPPSAALRCVEALLTCRPTTQALAAAHWEAADAASRLVSRGESLCQLTLGASEALWGMRRDVNGTTLLEAVARVRSRRDYPGDGQRADARGPGTIAGDMRAKTALVWSGRHVMGGTARAKRPEP